MVESWVYKEFGGEVIRLLPHKKVKEHYLIACYDGLGLSWSQELKCRKELTLEQQQRVVDVQARKALLSLHLHELILLYGKAEGVRMFKERLNQVFDGIEVKS